MSLLNEYSRISEVAIRSPISSFVNNKKITHEWELLRFHAKPDLKKAISEYNFFKSLLEEDEIKIIELPPSNKLTLDSIYTRDSILLSKSGLILCNMGRSTRTPEA